MPYRMLVCWRVSGIHYTDYTWYTSNLHSNTIFSGWIPSYPLNLQFPAWVAHPTIFRPSSRWKRCPQGIPPELPIPSPSFRTLATSSWKVKVRSLALKETHRHHSRIWCLCHGDEGSLDVHIYIYTICMYICMYIYICISLSLCISMHVRKGWE